MLVFGGAMHADQDEHHPWLREEDDFLRHLLGLRVPTLGVCLGAQLLAKASDADVRPADEPEIGWYDVELTDAAADDPIFAELPRAVRRVPVALLHLRRPGGARSSSREAASARRRSGSANRSGACSSIPR